MAEGNQVMLNPDINTLIDEMNSHLGTGNFQQVIRAANTHKNQIEISDPRFHIAYARALVGAVDIGELNNRPILITTTAQTGALWEPLKAATELLKRAVDFSPDQKNAEAKFLMADMYLRRGKFLDAAGIANSAYQEEKEHKEQSYALLGWALYESSFSYLKESRPDLAKGQYIKSMQIVGEGLGRYPESMELLYCKVAVSIALDEKQLAYDSLKQLVALRPGDEGAIYWNEKFAERYGVDNALEIKIVPRNVTSSIFKKIKEGKYNDAIYVGDKLLSEYPDDAVLHYAAAIAYKERGIVQANRGSDFKRAGELYKRSLALNPKDVRVIDSYIGFLTFQKEYDTAIFYGENKLASVTSLKDDYEFLVTLSEAYIERGNKKQNAMSVKDYDAAKLLLDNAVIIFSQNYNPEYPRNPTAHMLRAEIASKEGDHNKVMELLEPYRGARKPYERFLKPLCVAYTKLGRNNEALEVSLQLKNLYPRKIVGYGHAVRLLRSAGEVEEALKIVTEMVGLFPDDPSARKLFAELGGDPTTVSFGNRFQHGGAYRDDRSGGPRGGRS
jgi:tetratricopeptide (TPR) repeat protein